ncbi:hypothetical protein DRO26_01585 [Candidatus Bathyarchaeota archaeon]|nr:MAG: hypothetical protein DRO26_01585 [Candidatus Bathyarchaeota archaeon]
MIFRFSSTLQELVNWILEEKNKGKSWSEIEQEISFRKSMGKEPFIYFKLINPKEKCLEVSVENTDFTLNLNKTIYQNASDYYEESKKIRKKILRLKDTLEETKTKLKTIEEGLETIKTEVEKPEKIPEKKWFEKYRYFYSSEGFLVVSGKDASSNEALIKRYTEPEDLVFHADVFGAPFTIVKTQGKIPTEKTLEEAAQFTACYSRAWKDELASVDVYYVKPDQLSKSAPSGQYLGRGAFTITGSKNYLHKIPLMLGVGVKLNEKAQVYVAPPTAVEHFTSYYVKVVPGKEDAKKIAFKIRSMIANLVPKDWKDKILKIPLENFVSHIPFGKGFIVQR